MTAEHGKWFAEPLNDATGVRLIKTTADDMANVVPALDARHLSTLVTRTEMTLFSDMLVTRTELHSSLYSLIALTAHSCVSQAEPLRTGQTIENIKHQSNGTETGETRQIRVA